MLRRYFAIRPLVLILVFGDLEVETFTYKYSRDNRPGLLPHKIILFDGSQPRLYWSGRGKLT